MNVSRAVVLGLGAQTAFGLAVMTSGVLAVQPRVVPVTVMLSVVSWVLALRWSARLREGVRALDLRAVLAFHTVRAPIGLAFLVMHSRGLLASEFALRAGYGDLASGLFALVPLALLHTGHPRARRALFAWNVFALADIVMVFVTAQRMLFGGRADGLAAFRIAPFPMVPAMVVPIVLLTHVLVFVRLRAHTEHAH